MNHVFPEGIGYSQFTEGYRKWRSDIDLVLRQPYTPGEKMFVDFAGRTVEIKDKNGGPSQYAQIFVAVLGYSNYTFVYAVSSQNTADWIKCHIECFNHLGGVPKWIIPDNLKAAVLRREKGKIIINPAYREFLSHYESAPLPTRTRKPQDKGKVEVGVQIAQRMILFPLRNFIFFSLEELNTELKKRLETLNSRPFKKYPGCRDKRFFNIEKACLNSLPPTPYEVCDWRYDIRVPEDYHVEHSRSFYSVPHQLRKQKVDIRYTSTMIEIMRGGQRVALHKLAEKEGEIITDKEHRPVTHLRVLEGEPKALMMWAEANGPHTKNMINHHLQIRVDATNGVRAARRMRESARQYGESRFEEVCAYALEHNMTTLRSIKYILKNSPDKTPSRSESSKTHPAHENVRGSSYYGESA